MSSATGTLPGQQTPPPAPPEPRSRRLVSWTSLLVVVATAVIGSNVFSVRDHIFGTVTPNAAPPAAGRVAGGTAGATQDTTAAAAPTSLRSEPWWQDVTSLDGVGATTAAPFTISSSAIQWRVKWTCGTGHLVVRAASQAKPLVDGTCPAGTEGYGVRSGPTTLQVTADGPWHLDIAQQIDAPLVEPPLPAMTAPGAATVDTGTFYNIDKVGTGRVTVYRQADGNYSLRLDDFFVSPNSDLELRMSPLPAPRTTADVTSADTQLIVVMDVTAGSLNYAVPPGVDISKYRSVVVWCRPISSAYAAASLVPAR